jgi:PAN domain
MRLKWYFILIWAAILIVSSIPGQPDRRSNVQFVGKMVNPELIEKVISEQGSEALPEAPVLSIEKNTDRPGMNYNSFYLPIADPQLCINYCANDSSCAAYTYVEPGFRGQNSQPECWLKNPAPNPVSQEDCISGVKTPAPPSGGSSWGQSTPTTMPPVGTGEQPHVKCPEGCYCYPEWRGRTMGIESCLPGIPCGHNGDDTFYCYPPCPPDCRCLTGEEAIKMGVQKNPCCLPGQDCNTSCEYADNGEIKWCFRFGQ